MTEMKEVCNVTELVKNDVVYYYHHENGQFYIENGTLKDDNIYTDGVEVHEEGWKQYVSKYFICKVERDGTAIFEQD